MFPCRVVAPVEVNNDKHTAAGAYEVEWLNGPDVGAFSALPSERLSRAKPPLARQVLKVRYPQLLGSMPMFPGICVWYMLLFLAWLTLCMLWYHRPG